MAADGLQALSFAVIYCNWGASPSGGTGRRCISPEDEFRRSVSFWTLNQRAKMQRDKVPQSSQLSLPRCSFNRRSGVSLYVCFPSATLSGNMENIGQGSCSSNGGSKFVGVAQKLTWSSVQANGPVILSFWVWWQIGALWPLSVPRESM